MLSIYYIIFNFRLPDSEFHSLLSILPRKDQNRILRFRRWQDRHIHLAGKLLLLKGLAERGFPEDILNSVKTTGYGKPFINGSIEFSLSNSGMCAVCAISNDGQIGIDVEAYTRFNISDLKSYMLLDEWENIQNAENRNEAFFIFWTKKESVLKADGRGLSVPLEQIHLENESATLSGKKWFIEKIDLGNPYICHLAASIKISDITLKMIDPGDLCFSTLRWGYHNIDRLDHSNSFRQDQLDGQDF